MKIVTSPVALATAAATGLVGIAWLVTYKTCFTAPPAGAVRWGGSGKGKTARYVHEPVASLIRLVWKKNRTPASALEPVAAPAE
jgi:hypothetical protein